MTVNIKLVFLSLRFQKWQFRHDFQFLTTGRRDYLDQNENYELRHIEHELFNKWSSLRLKKQSKSIQVSVLSFNEVSIMINYTILGLLFFTDFHLWFEFFCSSYGTIYSLNQLLSYYFTFFTCFGLLIVEYEKIQAKCWILFLFQQRVHTLEIIHRSHV